MPTRLLLAFLWWFECFCSVMLEKRVEKNNVTMLLKSIVFLSQVVVDYFVQSA